MIYWILAVIVVVVGVLVVMSLRRSKSTAPAEVKTHKPCSYCKEEIEIDAPVCKYCRGVVLS
ncbi:hypothetical protein [Paenibacillus qinlingensis]|uniref:Cytochrome c-type biogenesis protein CcmH/NrfF n=1 Tax=Paenibacillus qinlingensis TaxID=1837343 RepID=A0ABU1P7C3_9BACL|nr:hypothetical protein [Paenibacillus qinlingensis]MDR6555663.1 cytochrome c-type biogenesis protein CcmH/NrfF [Paenibacillus qinlingensis]